MNDKKKILDSLQDCERNLRQDRSNGVAMVVKVMVVAAVEGVERN